MNICSIPSFEAGYLVFRSSPQEVKLQNEKTPPFRRRRKACNWMIHEFMRAIKYSISFIFTGIISLIIIYNYHIKSKMRKCIKFLVHSRFHQVLLTTKNYEEKLGWIKLDFWSWSWNCIRNWSLFAYLFHQLSVLFWARSN